LAEAAALAEAVRAGGWSVADWRWGMAVSVWR
jgi:hypothetical protein